MAILSPELLSASTFAEVRPSLPDESVIGHDYDAIGRQLDEAVTVDDWLAVCRSWDDLRRRVQTWSAMAELQFQKNTRDPSAKSNVELWNELRPKIEGRDVAIKTRFLRSPLRPELERELGNYAFSRWESAIAAFDPRIETDLVKESKLSDAYTALLAGASIPFDGKAETLPALSKYGEHPQRAVREAAMRAKWGFFEEQHTAIESSYDQLVQIRTKMARDLGYANFVELGYKRLIRTDYTANDVANYRAEIERTIVPLCKRLVAAQTQRLGIDTLRIWDEGVFYLEGNSKPPGTYSGMMGAARAAFAGMSDELARFSSLMIDGSLLDLQLRDGKAGGGFCTSFPAYGLPYIFANFNGTTHDVNVLLHEMGHAFQAYSSRGKALSDYLWPTYDACEIHSMSMEFLSWPHLERFFGSDAPRYRAQHLAQSMMFLPYGAAVDHFQHLVYEHPDATPEERNGFWKELEARYLPWRNSGGIPFLERGGFWQQQRHIFSSPFYYIDYTLALNCALQFWMRSLDDYPEALADYTTLCGRGGEAPFQELARSAGLRSPFEPGVFTAIADRAESACVSAAANLSK